MSVKNAILNTEKGKAAFENYLRDLPLSVCKGFGSDSKLIPVRFGKSSLSLSAISSEVASSFPSTSQQNGTSVLEPINAPLAVSGKRIAVLFSGGPASGGHNVLLGLKSILGANNVLYGIKNGPKGLLEGTLFEISSRDLEKVCNLGGFDFLGSDRTKIKSEVQLEGVKSTVSKFNLDGIVVVGGDDSNTNAAFLAEYLSDTGCKVIGVPKTIDGDLQVGSILPISFGFDTATKIYSEMVGNILQDMPSSRKYWHFVKLMGRSASQIALEVALQTKPTYTLISEEIAEKKKSLKEIVTELVKVVVSRSEKGMNYGLVLVPEGLIEFIPELTLLIAKLNDLAASFDEDTSLSKRKSQVLSHLSDDLKSLFNSLPLFIQDQLLLDRDSHGKLKVSQIPTEKLLETMVAEKIKEESDVPFSAMSHFFGYEGRCGAPTRFDAQFTYNLGVIAGSLILDGRTGYMAALTDFDKGGRALAVPLCALLNTEQRSGKNELVIKKALVELDSPAFRLFETRRQHWIESDCFSSPGPRQYQGPSSNLIPFLVALNQGYKSLSFQIGSEQGKTSEPVNEAPLSVG
jgi:diphosphate-dependent phosphofructokinase